eukprot:992800-Rhodomonas_salina.1
MWASSVPRAARSRGPGNGSLPPRPPYPDPLPAAPVSPALGAVGPDRAPAVSTPLTSLSLTRSPPPATSPARYVLNRSTPLGMRGYTRSALSHPINMVACAWTSPWEILRTSW